MAVQITLIICVTLIALSLIDRDKDGKDGKGNGSK